MKLKGTSGCLNGVLFPVGLLFKVFKRSILLRKYFCLPELE